MFKAERHGKKLRIFDSEDEKLGLKNNPNFFTELPMRIDDKECQKIVEFLLIDNYQFIVNMLKKQGYTSVKGLYEQEK